MCVLDNIFIYPFKFKHGFNFSCLKMLPYGQRHKKFLSTLFLSKLGVTWIEIKTKIRTISLFQINMSILFKELTHWKSPWCWERLRAGEEGVKRGWDGWMASSTNGHELEQTPKGTEGQGSLACCSSQGCKESGAT